MGFISQHRLRIYFLLLLFTITITVAPQVTAQQSPYDDLPITENEVRSSSIEELQSELRELRTERDELETESAELGSSAEDVRQGEFGLSEMETEELRTRLRGLNASIESNREELNRVETKLSQYEGYTPPDCSNIGESTEEERCQITRDFNDQVQAVLEDKADVYGTIISQEEQIKDGVQEELRSRGAYIQNDPDPQQDTESDGDNEENTGSNRETEGNTETIDGTEFSDIPDWVMASGIGLLLLVVLGYVRTRRTDESHEGHQSGEDRISEPADKTDTQPDSKAKTPGATTGRRKISEKEKYERLTSEIEKIRNNLYEAEDQLKEFPETTLNRTDEIKERLEELKKESRGFDGLLRQVRDLQNRCEALRDRAEKKTTKREVSDLQRRSQPAPSMTVDYRRVDENDKQPVGSGGNADVYKTTYEGETIALKEPRMSGTLHTETVERFMDEAETWDRLDDHENIVSVIDYGSEPLPWMALEYMDGGDLTENIEEMGLDEKLWAAVCVTKGVRHAHRKGVAHLDLKPENVLFRTTGDDHYDVPKVADWGLAKMLLEHSKSIEGMSPQYSAPEQFDEEAYGKPDDMTDVYQLGAVFYELFTGKPPFEGQPSKVMHSVLHEEAKPPTEVNPDLPVELDEILLKALEKNKEERYETVIYIRDDLQKLL